MANEIDYVMDIAATELTDRDIDAIIAYERRMQANYEAGIKPSKEGAMTGQELLLKMGLAKPPEPLKRRF